VREALLPSDRQARLARLYAATALACLLAYAVPMPAFAQEIGDMAAKIPAGSQMLLAADTLVYNNDSQTVTAVGAVQIDYGGNRLVAQRVEYNRKTKRLVASGNVEVVNSDGTKINSEHIDITDDFADGFVNALRVETVDKAYFAAESAERMGGVLTTFHNGVYTACEPCEDQPNKAPTWRVKARQIIWNGEKKTVRFENANFEFFGFPLAYLPAFEIADPTVKRKSGFLIPGISYSSHLGYSVKIPYYLALAPTYDLTVSASGYTKQGFLGEAEWRQRFNNGDYSLKIAGIQQQDPEAFIDDAGRNVDSGPANDPNKFRGMMGTQGQFAINPRWDFGWDVLLQTDKNFSKTYNIGRFNQGVHESSVHLTGLNDRNYFDLRAMHFEVQEDTLDSNPAARNGRQPWVLPSLDYAYIPDMAVAGGQLSINANARVLSRNDLDQTYFNPYVPASGTQRVGGIEGQSGRFTAEAEWKRSFVTEDGLVLTPLLALQGDTNYVNASSASLAAVNEMATNLGQQDDLRSSFARYMATAGLEMRWPVLFSMASGSSHVFEPMAQVFMRPNEQYVGGLAVPNEDAQSMVFDATTLFERDKFSGYDRVEGGSRANVGVRYSGSYNNGWGTNAIFGQSYQIGGENSFAAPDLVNVGAYSGLQTTKSDYVALFGVNSPNGFAASVSGRFDEDTAEVRRAEVKAAYSGLPISFSAKYAFIQAQPLYGFTTDRHEVTLGGSTHLTENWRVFGTGTYDIEQSVLVRDGVGFAYNDSCFTYLMTYSQSRDLNTREVTQNIGLNLSFRTLGDFGSSTGSVDTIQ
jgi:LPS-assembly protein